MSRVRTEEQGSFWPHPADAHELVRVSACGDWWRGTCSCGWLSDIKPLRRLVEAQHYEHIRHARQPWHEWVTHRHDPPSSSSSSSPAQ